MNVVLVFVAAWQVRLAPWPAHPIPSALIIAEDEHGQVLGRAAMEVCSIHCGRRSRHPDSVLRPLLSGMIVDPLHRRQGVGGGILAHAEEQAVAWGFSEVVLNVQRSNGGAHTEEPAKS